MQVTLIIKQSEVGDNEVLKSSLTAVLFSKLIRDYSMVETLYVIGLQLLSTLKYHHLRMRGDLPI